MTLSTFVSYVKNDGVDVAIMYAECCGVSANLIQHWINVAKAA